VTFGLGFKDKILALASLGLVQYGLGLASSGFVNITVAIFSEATKKRTDETNAEVRSQVNAFTIGVDPGGFLLRRATPPLLYQNFGCSH